MLTFNCAGLLGYTVDEDASKRITTLDQPLSKTYNLYYYYCPEDEKIKFFQ